MQRDLIGHVEEWYVSKKMYLKFIDIVVLWGADELGGIVMAMFGFVYTNRHGTWRLTPPSCVM